jgi:hypothetical protein
MLLRNTRRKSWHGNACEAILCVSVVGATLSASLAAAPGELRGVIVDPNGTQVGYSHVIIRDDLAGTDKAKSEIRTLSTGRTGRFTASLQPGFHDVCVMADGFQAICKKIKIVDGKPIDVRFDLKPDRDVFKAIADYVLPRKEDAPERPPMKR